jgi:hypothetical protein
LLVANGDELCDSKWSVGSLCYRNVRSSAVSHYSVRELDAGRGNGSVQRLALHLSNLLSSTVR